MKINNILRTILITLVVIVLTAIAFLGIFVTNKNTVVNVLRDYKLGKDLAGYRVLELEVNDDVTTLRYDAEGNLLEDSDTETEVASTQERKNNEDELLTLDNFEQSKKIIEKRLSDMQVKDYTISQNRENGKIVVEIPENDDTDNVVYQLMYQGKFEVVDSDTNEVLMTNDDLDSVVAGYGTTESGTTSIFINYQFNKEGTEKFKNITTTYVETTVEKETTDETTIEEGQEETTEPETETITREITIKIDGDELLTTHFDDVVENGLLQLSFGSSTSLTTDELQERLIQANSMAVLLDCGKLPILYDVVQNRFMYSDVTTDQIKTIAYAFAVVILAGCVYFVARFKLQGLKVSMALVGYISTLLIAVRIFNVEISIAALVTILFSIVLCYVIMASSLKNDKNGMKDPTIKALGRYLFILIPAFIIAIVLTVFFVGGGEALFWGLVINSLYNLLITRTLLLNLD